jgi:DNA-binding XRE family transcriptional regulator
MADVAVITMPEEQAGAISEYDRQVARCHMLEGALIDAIGEFHGICEERVGNLHGYAGRLRGGFERLRMLVEEVAKFAEADDRYFGFASNRVEELRMASGLDVQELAQKLGVDDSTIVDWEKGKSAIPDECKPRLAQLFGVSVVWLMREEEGER